MTIRERVAREQRVRWLTDTSAFLVDHEQRLVELGSINHKQETTNMEIDSMSKRIRDHERRISALEAALDPAPKAQNRGLSPAGKPQATTAAPAGTGSPASSDTPQAPPKAPAKADDKKADDKKADDKKADDTAKSKK